MQETTVKKEELLARLRENRLEHRENFLRGLVGYKKLMLEEMERRVEELRQGRMVSRTIGFEEPCDYTKEYDRVIEMLEMSVDDEITITGTEFRQFVMDDWSWKEHFLANVTSYHGLDAESELAAIEQARMDGTL